MDALRQAKGAEFDRLFLTGMIQHHNGALVMVKELFDTPGAGQDAELFDFATDADNYAAGRDQNYAKHVEGETMNRMQALAFRLAGVAFGTAVVCSSWGVLRAQAPTAPAAPAAQAGSADEEEDPFAPQPPAPLPPGMTGFDDQRSARRAEARALRRRRSRDGDGASRIREEA